MEGWPSPTAPGLQQARAKPESTLRQPGGAQTICIYVPLKQEKASPLLYKWTKETHNHPKINQFPSPNVTKASKADLGLNTSKLSIFL